MGHRDTNGKRAKPVAAAIGAMIVVSLSACAEFTDWMAGGPAETAIDAKAQADAASLWEMTLMAGRYGVMLDQAREILALPEPKDGPLFPSDSQDDRAQRKALAEYQVIVADQFFADAARACRSKRLSKSLRVLACKDQKQIAANLRAPAAPEIPALSSRNEAVGGVVMPWWNAVCASAPKPKRDDEPVCAME